MNPEVRKEYNKKYYTANKEAILQKALQKVECQFCQKQVIQNNINKHQQTKLCKNRQAKNKIIKERSEL